MIVVRLVSPSTQAYGYLSRFMSEMETGLLVGSCTRPLLDEVVAILRVNEEEGFVLVAEPKSETGFLVPYFKRRNCELVDYDGVPLVKRRSPSRT